MICIMCLGTYNFNKLFFLWLNPFTVQLSYISKEVEEGERGRDEGRNGISVLVYAVLTDQNQ